MKKIGILFGQETTFPPAFVERVNSKNESAKGGGITAEFVKIDKVIQGDPSDMMLSSTEFHRTFLSTELS